MAITPNVRTIVRLGGTTRVMTSRGYHLRRDAQEIGRGIMRRVARSYRVQATSEGDAIILREKNFELAQLQKTENEADVIGQDAVNMAPSFVARKIFRRNDDLPGAVAAPSVLATGISTFRKRPIDNWATTLPATIPAPDPDVEATQTRPLERILEGKVSYPENTPFQVLLRLPPNHDVGVDALCNFYFGGPASVTPQEATGGRYCLTVRGSGVGVLYEWENVDNPNLENPWKERKRLLLTPLGNLENNVSIWITPYGRDRIWVRTIDANNTNTTAAAARALQHFLLVMKTRSLPGSLFIDEEKSSGHRHQRTSTGAGNIMLDYRQLPRADVGLVRGKFFPAGVLYDGPFEIPRETPGGTPIRLRLDTYTLEGCTVTAALFDAATHNELSQDGSGRYLSVAGQRHYYARISLASADGLQTPVLWAYHVDIEPTFELRATDPVTAPVHGTRVTGAGLEPDHESVSFGLIDRYGDLARLRVQDRVRGTLSLVHPTTGAVISHLMEGETLQIRAKRHGTPEHLPNWYEYDARLVGLWSKLRRQFYTGNIISFVNDPNPMITGPNQPAPSPWKVTDAIRFLLQEAGVPSDEIDVPDYPLRFWSGNADDTSIQYGTDFAALIAKLARDYLGSTFIRDPNAGARGMWRLLRNPRPPFTHFLAGLYTERPAGITPGHPATRAHAFGTGTVLAESWETWVEGPEVTHLTVEGIARDGGAKLVSTAFLRGWNDPGSPNYTAGEMIPFTVGPEPSLNTQEAVDWQARTIIERSQARKWWRMTAALLLIRDPRDPHQTHLRPLRVNDLVQFNGYPALVRSCDLFKKSSSDRFWQMEIEGIFL